MKTNPRRQRQNDHAGGVQDEKCTPARRKSGSDQRAHEDKFLAASVKMIMPAGKRDENARRRGEERQRPAGT
ncbi:MAG: hypothetical protein ACLR23_05375 [Clostridia bacterium]